MARKTMKAEFREILEKIPDDKKVIGKKLIEELSFMEKTLASLKRQKTGSLNTSSRASRIFLGKAQLLRAITQPYSAIASCIGSLPTLWARRRKPRSLTPSTTS